MAKKEEATSAASSPMADRSGRRRPPLPEVAPWLVIPYGKGRRNQAFYNLCEPGNKTCQKFVSELSGKIFYQKSCHQGWLVILCADNKINYSPPTWKHGDCFLWNPTTLETIQLPNILSSVYTFDEYVIVDSVLSSPPRTCKAGSGDGDDDPLVFFLLRGRHEMYNYVLLFCRPGDQQWRTQRFIREKHSNGDNSILSLHYLKGSLYGMSCSRISHFKIDIEQIGGCNNVNLCVRQIETVDDTHFPWIGGHYTCGRKKYVQTCDELYRLDLRSTDEGKEVIAVEITRLDFSIMGWKEVNCLGDDVLFCGANTTACCSAAELGLTRGCLYYTLPTDQSLYKYELEGSGTIMLPCLKLPTPYFCSDWIMMPATFRVGHTQERTKFMFDEREKEDGGIMKQLIVKTTNSAFNVKEKQDGGKVKQQTPWNILNDDIIQIISSYLHPTDYKRFRLVCKANRSILSVAKHVSNKCGSPWLVFSSSNDCTVYSFVDPMHNNESYSMERAVLRRATIRYQKGGWLLMSEGAHKLFFHNPFTKETIELPDLSEVYLLSHISFSFSSLPTCSGCVVFGITEGYDMDIRVYTIARGEKSWRYQEYNNTTSENYMPLLNAPVLCKGILYSVDYNGLLGAFSLENGISWSYQVLEKPCAKFTRQYPSFLVECGGDLVLVKLGRNGALVGIFRLDFSEMEWVRVTSLGKYMLFISYASCVSRMAPCVGMENKIYFPRLSLYGEGILFYSLDTNRYHSLESQHSSKDFYDTKGWSSWSWIEPNWSRSTTRELDWFTTLP